MSLKKLNLFISLKTTFIFHKLCSLRPFICPPLVERITYVVYCYPFNREYSSELTQRNNYEHQTHLATMDAIKLQEPVTVWEAGRYSLTVLAGFGFLVLCIWNFVHGLFRVN